MSVIRVFSGCLRAAFLVTLAAPSWAQQSLSLREAERLALARSQQIVAKDAAAGSAREMSVSAGQLPDPVLKLGINNVPLSGPERLSLSQDFMTMRSIGVMQELTRKDKRQLRVERLEREVDRIQAEKLAAASEVLRETALAWLERYYAQAMVDLVRRQLEQAELEVQGADIAYRTGRGSQADLFGARTALANLRDMLREAERQVRSATVKLARWIGAEEARRPALGPVPWQVSATADVLSTGQYRQLPQLAMLAARMEAAETEVRQAQANTRADWTVEAMYSKRGPAFSDMVSIGLTIPLQIDQRNRQDRDVAAKVAALAEARANYEDALRAQEAEVKVLLNDWNTGKERLERLQTELLPAVRMRTEGALTAYQTAKGELMAVLAARREEIQAGLQLLNLEMETARLWAQLNYLIPDGAALAAPKEQP